MVLVLSLLLTACTWQSPGSGAGTSTTTIEDGAPLATGKSAARDVVSAIDEYGLHSVESGWLDQRRQFTDDIDKASSAPALLRTVSSALRAGGGPHSFLLLQDAQEPAGPVREPSVSVRHGVGVLSVPAAAGSSTRREQKYASALDRAIQTTRGRVCGWVVDLRSNSGGSVVPPFVGLSALLPEGTLVALVDNDRDRAVAYSLDGSRLRHEPGPWANLPGLLSADRDFPTVPRSPKITQPVAVFQSGETGSAGEAVVVAFKGRADTRFFGQPTYGAASGNIALSGPFGSTAVLTVGLFQDRVGTVYPEDPISAGAPTAPGESLDAARDWISAMGCSRPL